LKFVADGMLGSLVRWLRMMGHDAEYSRGIDDDKLMAWAKTEKRILLTRDLELFKRSVAKGLDVFYVEGKNEAERLATLAQRFGITLEIDLRTSRCPRCNTMIQPVPRAQVEDRVEKNTFAHYDEFWECPNCKKVYWQGAHWPKICGTLEDAKKRAKSDVGF
jgi:uncharacterized protein with PIN domain